MAQRTCDVEGCERKHQARGMCTSHWSRWYRETHPDRDRGSREAEMVTRTCVVCGTDWRTRSRVAKYCSELCYHYDKWGARTCPWPKPEPKVRATPKPKPEPFHARRDCAWCGLAFETARPSQVYCEYACKRKAIRNRRRGREYGSTSHYTWAEVMRLFVHVFDRACAYCEQPINGAPEPDHVVPLSRGGSNSITNILPACSLCNADKRDLLLSEWALDRERRGKAPRVTSWPTADPRVVHLTDATLISPAA